jgi:hypothetical protein
VEANSRSNPDLIKITEIFLIPSSFLVAALGTADTNPHRAAVSVLGLVISGLWWVCSREALADAGTFDTKVGQPAQSRRRVILSHLSSVFVVGWLISTVIHVVLWSRPL